jgi:hypothetical protein
MVIVFIAAGWLAVLALFVALRLNATRRPPEQLPGERASVIPLPLAPRAANAAPLPAEAQSSLAGPGQAVSGF